ncbi:hypothetical protein [Vulcanisaeta sp. JCM 16159]
MVPVLFDLRPKECIKELYDFRDELNKLIACYRDGRIAVILAL